MNIRADSEEIRFRLSQEEVGVLLADGLVREEITLPISQICFQVEFGNQTRIVQEADGVVFWLAPSERDKFKHPFDAKDPIVMVYEEIKGKNVCFKLEVDVFKPRQREQRK